MYSWDESSAKEPDALDPEGRFPLGLEWLHTQLGGHGGMGNFVQHMGLWRADTHYVSNQDWDWQVPHFVPPIVPPLVPPSYYPVVPSAGNRRPILKFHASTYRPNAVADR